MRALPAVGLGEGHVPMDGQRAARVVTTQEHFDERSEDREIVVLGDVRLLRRGDERMDGVVEITPAQRSASSLAQVIEVIEHRWASLSGRREARSFGSLAPPLGEVLRYGDDRL